MPSKDRDVDLDDRIREKRPRSKSEQKNRDRDRDRDKDKDRDRERDREKDREKDSPSSSRRHHRHKSSRSSKSRPGDSEITSHSYRRHRTKDTERDEGRDDLTPSPMADTVPELSRTSMAAAERTTLPYPSFSKAHSKENVHSKEDISTPAAHRTDPLTPEATDIGSADVKRSKSVDYTAGQRQKPSPKNDRPPSPPETNFSAEQRPGTPLYPPDGDAEGERPRSWISKSTSKNDDNKSKLSMKSKSSSQATFILSPGFKVPTTETTRDGDSSVRDGKSSDLPGSAATSVATKRVGSGKRSGPVEVDSSPESAPDSSPKTPTHTPHFPPSMDGEGKEPTSLRGQQDHDKTPSRTPATNRGPSAAPPPPPPPPPLSIQEAPRVDYLMLNGGLLHSVPKTFLSALPRQNGNRPSNPPLRGAETLFAPFFNLLDQYQSVLSGQGSLAVATGHRTVARRLLDRLENVFSRDLPPEGCPCVVCERSDEPHRGLGWGEVLERISGRLDLPQWPPFDLQTLGINAMDGSADVPPRPSSPVKIDPDIAEEFREHYLRQSKKVRSAVDKWLTNCAEAPAPPPSEVDDETLAFAILTSLEQEDKPFFNALMSGSRDLQPTIRAPTPLRKPRTDFIVKTGLALQRLYRLPKAPRDAETVMYLIKNKHTHDLLHTITDINPSEWEILTSGRFDGFLWSGADDDALTPTAETPSRGATPASGFFPPPARVAALTPGLARYQTPGLGTTSALGSRATTPFSGFSRGATPASFVSGTSFASSAATGTGFFPNNRPAVSHDEETEVAVLAEVEREIYIGMEALEDAFETLHQRAEAVRTALRQRGAGLSMSLQSRRGGGGLGGAGGIDVLPRSGDSGASERPAWATGPDDESLASESDWGGDDIESLAPDDSASNISSSRARRPKRRNERRTPALIEEDEDEV